MKQIRKGVFETNSSSTHSLTICTEDEYEAWKKGEFLLDEWNGKLVKTNTVEENDREDCKTFEQWENNNYMESYFERYTSPSGDKIIVFGEYGYDG